MNFPPVYARPPRLVPDRDGGRVTPVNILARIARIGSQGTAQGSTAHSGAQTAEEQAAEILRIEAAPSGIIVGVYDSNGERVQSLRPEWVLETARHLQALQAETEGVNSLRMLPAPNHSAQTEEGD